MTTPPTLVSGSPVGRGLWEIWSGQQMVQVTVEGRAAQLQAVADMVTHLHLRTGLTIRVEAREPDLTTVRAGLRDLVPLEWDRTRPSPMFRQPGLWWVAGPPDRNVSFSLVSNGSDLYPEKLRWPEIPHQGHRGQLVIVSDDLPLPGLEHHRIDRARRLLDIPLDVVVAGAPG